MKIYHVLPILFLFGCALPLASSEPEATPWGFTVVDPSTVQVDPETGGYRYYDGCTITTCNKDSWCITTHKVCPEELAVTCQNEAGEWELCP